jgi:hypothetical protein
VRDCDSGVTDVLGVGGVYRDPLWRVTVQLTALERELLRCWWVRRLAFVAHAGAAVITTVQTYSRLEHSLGVLALVSHFAPDDVCTRAAALLHDVGHLPMSHTFEGVAGLDHHQLGAVRIAELGPLLARHGLDAADVLATVEGHRASVLGGVTPAVLKMDHLDSFVRSGRTHGTTRQPPAETLHRVTVIDGAVSTDADTAGYLLELIGGEARRHCSPANALPVGVVRHLADVLLHDAPRAVIDEVATMTDDEFWMLLCADPRTAAAAIALRKDPAGWTISAGNGQTGIGFTVTRLYLDLPLVEGNILIPERTFFDELPTPPWSCTITPPADAAAL